MAATNRVRLLGRALIEQDVDTSVLCMRVSERPGEVRNHAVSGVADGIAYRLHRPAPRRVPPRSVPDAWREARGLLWAPSTISPVAGAEGAWTVCTWRRCRRRGSRASGSLLRWLRRLGVPVVVELNELPSEVTWLPDSLSRRLSHLDGATGAVAISAWLKDWVQREAVRIGRPHQRHGDPDRGRHRRAPGDRLPGESAQVRPTLRSNEYGRAVTFILRALRTVWSRYPECELTVTGMRPEDRRFPSRRRGSVRLRPACPRRRVRRARPVAAPVRRRLALLIPLFDDLRSQARFPTKIGEYLARASGRDDGGGRDRALLRRSRDRLHLAARRPRSVRRQPACAAGRSRSRLAHRRRGPPPRRGALRILEAGPASTCVSRGGLFHRKCTR